MSQLEEKGKTGILFDHFFSGMCECTNTRCFLLNMLGYCFCLARVTYEFIQQIKIQLTRVQRFVNTWYFAIRSCVCWVSECVCVYLCLLCQNLWDCLSKFCTGCAQKSQPNTQHSRSGSIISFNSALLWGSIDRAKIQTFQSSRPSSIFFPDLLVCLSYC